MPTIKIYPDNDIEFVDSDGNKIAELGYHNISQSGVVGGGDFSNLYTFELSDGETIRITRASFVQSDLSVVPSGVDLALTDGSSVKTVVLSGDGATLYPEETGEPLDSYTNTTGSPETLAFGVDNGQFNAGAGEQVDVQASLISRVVA